MKKRFLISLMAAVLLLPVGIIATAAPAADTGSAANGICRAACAYAQNCSSGANQNNYVDEDNDGVCDNRQEGTCANAGDANRHREKNGGGQGNNSNASNGNTTNATGNGNGNGNGNSSGDGNSNGSGNGNGNGNGHCKNVSE